MRSEAMVDGVHIPVVVREPLLLLLRFSLEDRTLGDSLPAYAIHPTS